MAGAPGADGGKGEAGDRGSDGPKGPAGERGEPGVTGVGSTVIVSGSGEFVLGLNTTRQAFSVLNPSLSIEKTGSISKTELNEIGAFFAEPTNFYLNLLIENNNTSSSEWVVAELYKNNEPTNISTTITKDTPVGIRTLKKADSVSSGHPVSIVGSPSLVSPSALGDSSVSLNGSQSLIVDQDVFHWIFDKEDFTVEGRFSFDSDGLAVSGSGQTLFSNNDWGVKYISASTNESRTHEYFHSGEGTSDTPIISHVVKNTGDVSVSVKASSSTPLNDVNIEIKIYVNGILNTSYEASNTDIHSSPVELENTILTGLVSGNVISYTCNQTNALVLDTVVTESMLSSRLEVFYVQNGTVNTLSADWSPAADIFYHIAMIRMVDSDGSSPVSKLNLHVDGSRVINETIPGDTKIGGFSNNSLFIGSHPSPSGATQSDFFEGNIDEIRVLKDIAEWTVDNFSVPTEPYTSNSYTKLLLHMEGAVGSSVFTDEASGSDSSTIAVAAGDKLAVVFTSSNVKKPNGIVTLRFAGVVSVVGKQGKRGMQGLAGPTGTRGKESSGNMTAADVIKWSIAFG